MVEKKCRNVKSENKTQEYDVGFCEVITEYDKTTEVTHVCDT